MSGLWLAAVPVTLWGWLAWRGRRWPTPDGPEHYRATHNGRGRWEELG